MSQSKKTVKQEGIGAELKQLAQKFFGQDERLKQIEKSLSEAPKLIPGKVTGQEAKGTSSHLLSKDFPSQIGVERSLHLMEKTQRPLPKSELWKGRTWHLPERYKYFTGRDTFLKRMQKQLETGQAKRAVLTASFVNTEKSKVPNKHLQEEDSTLSSKLKLSTDKTPLSNTSQIEKATKKQQGKSPIVSGPGGIGKTALAVEYAYQALKRNAYQEVFWFDVGQDLELQYRDLARHLGIPFDSKTPIKVIIERVYRCLSDPPNKAKTSEKKVLLIFDNAKRLVNEVNTEQSLSVYFPPKSSTSPYSLLISSRKGDVWGNAFKQFPLGVFTTEESIEYIQKLLSEVGDEDAKSLAKLVNCYPLALSQAVSYIKQSTKEDSIALVQYIQDYKVRKQALLSTNQAKTLLGDPYKHSLWVTLGFSIRAIKNEEAHELLHFCSYLHPRGIPKFLLKSLLGEGKQWKELDKTLTTLHDYSLLTQAGRGQVQVHAMVQSVIRSTHKVSFREALLTSLSTLVINRYAKEVKPLVKEQFEQDLLKHLEQLEQHLHQKTLLNSLTQNMIMNSLLLQISHFYLKRGLPKQVLSRLLHLEKALEVSACDDKKNPSLGFILENISIAYGDLGVLDRQKEFAKQALKIQQAYYGQNSWQVASALDKLANSELHSPRRKKELAEQSLKIKLTHYGQEHWEVAITLGILANAYGSIGDPKRQKKCAKRALIIIQAHYRQKHWRMTTVLQSLANAYGDLGMLERQKELLKKVLVIEQVFYGQSSWQVAVTLDLLASAYGRLGYCRRQKELAERALKIKQAYHGPSSWQVAVTLEILSSAYGVLGNFKLRKRTLQRALEIMQAHYGQEHWTTASILVSLASIHGYLEKPERQIELANRALKILQAHYGQNHWKTVTTLEALSTLYWLSGNPKHSITLIKKALKINNGYFDRNQQHNASLLSVLACAYGDIGKYQKEIEILSQLLDKLKTYFGEKHWREALILRELGCAYGRSNQQVKKTLIKRAMKIIQIKFGKRHWYFGRLLLDLSKSNLTLKNKVGFSQLYQSYRILLNQLGRRHIFTKEARNLLDEIDANSPKGFMKAILWSALHREANKLLFENKPKEAIKVYKELFQVGRHPASAYHNIACCYHAVGDIKRAEIHFKKGITLTTSPEIYCDYGLFLYKRKRYEEAVRQFNLTLGKKEVDSGLSYGMMEKPLLDQYLQQEISEGKDLKVNPVWLAYYLLLRSYEKLHDDKKRDAMLKVFHNEIEKNPTPLLYRLLSYTYAHLNDEKQAQLFMEKSKTFEAELAKQKKSSGNPITSQNMVKLLADSLSSLSLQQTGESKTTNLGEGINVGISTLDDTPPTPSETSSTEIKLPNQLVSSSDESSGTNSNEDDDFARALAMSLGR